MKIHNFAYLCKEGTKNIFSNKLMSFACIGVLVACLLLIGSAVLFTLNVNSVVQTVSEQNEFVVFLLDDMTADDLGVYDVALANVPNVLSKRFVSREEGFEQDKQKLGEDAYLFDGIDASAYPNSYVVRVEDVALLEQTVAAVQALDGTDKINASTEVAKMLVGLRQVVAYAGAVVVLILIVVSIVIITNTIKLTVYSRRKEINIMKYVGATDSFIRLPFLVEGMMLGIIAALLAFSILGVGYTYLLRYVGENYGEYIGIVYENAVPFETIALELLAGFGILGVLIGTAGSGVFVQKHLRV
jgi:cell division transport system permease protein